VVLDAFQGRLFCFLHRSKHLNLPYRCPNRATYATNATNMALSARLLPGVALITGAGGTGTLFKPHDTCPRIHGYS
jgi:NAD(P)-dependent dehydrogenase (short-subunit alcohol dehydrogenase family)